MHGSCAPMQPALPWSIIAITFTNKAAGELKERLEAMLGSEAADVWASTFHSACVRILRRDIDRLGFDKSFTIYDSADSQRVIKDIVKSFSMMKRRFSPAQCWGISVRPKTRWCCRNSLLQEWVTPGDWRMERIAKKYTGSMSAACGRPMRWISMISFSTRSHCFSSLMRCGTITSAQIPLCADRRVSGHQQFAVSPLLAPGWGTEQYLRRGDDDQSIYRFRGANIENILSFEKDYPKARVIRLEQNYRSTRQILEASNAVIRHNEGRKGKTLWTEERQRRVSTYSNGVQ